MQKLYVLIDCIMRPACSGPRSLPWGGLTECTRAPSPNYFECRLPAPSFGCLVEVNACAACINRDIGPGSGYLRRARRRVEESSELASWTSELKVVSRSDISAETRPWLQGQLRALGLSLSRPSTMEEYSMSSVDSSSADGSQGAKSLRPGSVAHVH